MLRGWRVDLVIRPDGGRHVWPASDYVAHELYGFDCICGPESELIVKSDGSISHWLITHHALDARE